MHEYRGAIHVHTAYGDGSGSMPEIVAAAQARGLDFLAVTDHCSLAARADGWEGWHGRLLVLVGAEVHTERATVHYLALGTTHTPAPEAELRERSLFQYVHDHGGRLFLAHPQGVRPAMTAAWGRPWNGSPATCVDGLELWSYMHDWMERFQVRRMLHFHRRHGDEVRGPNATVLAAWDRLTQRRRLSALAGLDNHARVVPLLGLTYLPYEALFGTISTHVLLDAPLTGCATADVREVTEALGQGAAFLANDALADARGFRFEGVSGLASVGPGGRLALDGSTRLRLSSPVAAEWRMVCAGRVLAQAEGRTLEVGLAAPGAYHVQGRLRDRFWLVTNPIYVSSRQ
jgi:hypothetical protein